MLTGMKKRSLFAVPVLFASLLAHGQAAPSPGQTIPGPGPTPDSNSDKKDEKVGSYHLVTTFYTPGPTIHALQPQPVIELKAASPRNPGEASGAIPIPDQYSFEGLGQPSFECVPVNLQQNGCDSLDIKRIVTSNPKSISFRFTNHGPAVKISLNLQVRDLVLRSQQENEQDWSADQVIFVSVPKPTPTFNFVSETLVGVWNSNAVVFEPGKALPPAVQKALQDQNIRQDLGDKTLYSYKVKDPKKASSKDNVVSESPKPQAKAPARGGAKGSKK